MEKNGTVEQKRKSLQVEEKGNDAGTESNIRDEASSVSWQDHHNVPATTSIDTSRVSQLPEVLHRQRSLQFPSLLAGNRNVDSDEQFANNSLNLFQQSLRMESNPQHNMLQERIGGLRSLEPSNPAISSPPMINLRQNEGRRDVLPQPRLWLQQQQHSANASALASATAAPPKAINAQSRRSDDSNTLEKPSRLPCRARGMPEDHDFSSAYFETSSAKHGDPLICSFAQCRNEGIKFLYCDVCRDAVGRRVFRNQHHHLDVRAPKIAGASQNAASAIGAAGIGDAASQNMSSQILGSSLDLCLPSSGREKHEGATKFLPCRARGMPIEHDFKRAYLVVTEDTEHGEGLVCSFPTCRNAGIKFRYCKLCNDAIARRSFKEHQASHDADVDAVEDQTGEIDRKLPAKLQDGMNVSTLGGTNDRIIGQSRELNKPEAVLGAINTSDAQVGSGPKEQFAPSAKRQKAWDSLLNQRPSRNNQGAMKIWLEKVVFLSDLQSSDADLDLWDSSGTPSEPTKK